MKVFILDIIESPKGNGWTTHKFELSKKLSKLGCEVHVITSVDTELDGMVVYYMKKFRPNLVYNILRLINILKVILSNNIDILYTRNILFALLIFPIKNLTKSKLVLELNGLVSEHKKFEERMYKIKLLKKLQMVVMDWVEIFISKKVDAVIAVTCKIKDILVKKKIPENKITVIPNGANVELFRPIDNLIAVNELRKQYGINGNPVVMFVGNLAYWQGVEDLIQSAPLVLKAIPDTVFLIVGDGEMKYRLVELAKKIGVSDKCIFTGNVPYEKVPLYINMADVCVVPKKVLGFGYSPLKLYEYMACGKPVIATNTEGFEILEKYNAGILVNPENLHEFSNAIIKLLQDKQLREQMGVNGRKLVDSEYSWESSARKTIKVFKNILK